MKQLLLYAVLAAVVGGCQNPSPTRPPVTNAEGTPPPIHALQSSDPLDKRIPVPLLPRMAEHQRENMRDHLAAVQEIMAAVSAGDFAGVERSAARMGYSEQMGHMCMRMGVGAPGFNEMALHFHHTADTIGEAARRADQKQVLQAVSATLSTCTGCHAVYRQQIVDEAAWKRIVVDGGKTIHIEPDHS